MKAMPATMTRGTAPNQSTAPIDTEVRATTNTLPCRLPIATFYESTVTPADGQSTVIRFAPLPSHDPISPLHLSIKNLLDAVSSDSEPKAQNGEHSPGKDNIRGGAGVLRIQDCEVDKYQSHGSGVHDPLASAPMITTRPNMSKKRTDPAVRPTTLAQAIQTWNVSANQLNMVSVVLPCSSAHNPQLRMPSRKGGLTVCSPHETSEWRWTPGKTSPIPDAWYRSPAQYPLLPISDLGSDLLPAGATPVRRDHFSPHVALLRPSPGCPTSESTWISIPMKPKVRPNFILAA